MTNYEPYTDTPSASLHPMLEGVLQRVRLRARRRIAWLRMVWQQNSATAPAVTASASYHSEVDGYLTNTDSPLAEATWLDSDADVQPWNRALVGIETALLADEQTRLALLVRTFGLNRAETDTIQACLALTIDPNLGRVYAYLHDHTGRGYVTESLVARLFGHGYWLPIGPDSPLFAWGLVVAHDMGRGEPARLDCDPFIRHWLLGISDTDEALPGLIQPQPTRPPLPGWPVESTVELVGN